MEQIKRNLTLHLPADLIRKAKIYAAERDASINTLVKDLLEAAVTKNERMRDAAVRILGIARNGPHSAVDPGTIRRAEIHERW